MLLVWYLPYSFHPSPCIHNKIFDKIALLLGSQKSFDLWCVAIKLNANYLTRNRISVDVQEKFSAKECLPAAPRRPKPSASRQKLFCLSWHYRTNRITGGNGHDWNAVWSAYSNEPPGCVEAGAQTRHSIRHLQDEDLERHALDRKTGSRCKTKKPRWNTIRDVGQLAL